MVKIKIDGIEYEVNEKKNLIDAAEEVGIKIPYFCYHPALSVVGMCRMCLIEIEGVPKFQAACNTPVKEGLSIITKSDRVVEARKGTMEFLLANHPLDCPVCDKAGECDLQDNSYGHGKPKSRFEFEKRNIPQEDIGTNLVINHNRCIVCYRCVRFEEEVVGESNLGLFQRGHHSIIGLAKDKPISHNYQGALADICPVGALLNKNLMFKSRVWWYKTSKSICHGCSTGCNVYTNVRNNKMYRYMTRENPELNMYFSCDRGRFDINWLNDDRLFTYMENGKQSESTFVIPKIFEKLQNANKIGFIGGSHETNENLQRIKDEFKKTNKNLVFETRIEESQYNPQQVDFLMTNDFHPNTAGSVELGFTNTGKIGQVIDEFNSGKIDLLFVLKEEIPAEIKGQGAIVVLHTNLTESVKKADYAVPIKAFAEQTGSFTNKNGIKQSFEMSLNPPQGLLSSGEFFIKLFESNIRIRQEATVGTY